MKTYLAGLQNSTQTSYSNNGVTTLVGRAFQKTINSQQVVGPALTNFIDVQTVAGFAPNFSYFVPSANHLFVIGPISATPTVALFNFNDGTGAYSYVGKIIMHLGNAAATTHITRGFSAYSDGTNIRIVLGTTATPVINGGVYVAYTTVSAFTGGGTILFSAASTGQNNAVYFLQGSDFYGVTNNITTIWGQEYAYTSSSSSVNTKIFAFNNTVALPQVVSWDLATTPAVAGTITNGVSAQTTLFAGTSPSAFFTMGASQNGYSTTTGEPVVLMNGTGNVPTSFTAWNGAAAQVAASNVYFMRDLQLVSGNYYFNLSTTSGGAAVTPTSTTSSFTMMRAFGTSTNTFYGRTPVAGMTPALTGTINQANTVEYAKPTSCPANTALNGQDCLGVSTSSTMYLGKVSDLFQSFSGTTNGTTTISSISSTATLVVGMSVVGPGIPAGATIATIASGTSITISLAATASATVTLIFGTNNWSSMTGVNATGTGIDIVAPTIAFSRYGADNLSTDIDRFLYITNTSSFVLKPLQNSSITSYFGGVQISYLELGAPSTTDLGLAAITGLDFRSGWMFICNGTTTGQRGIIYADLLSDAFFGFSGVISPVIQSPVIGSTLKYIHTLEQLFDSTNSLTLWIRSSVANDSTFSSGKLPTVASPGNWTLVRTAQDLSSITVNSYFQIAATFQVISNYAQTPAQLNDFVYALSLPGEISDNWTAVNERTSQSGSSPMYVSVRQTKAYSVAPTKFSLKGYDDSGNLLITLDTLNNASAYEVSNNNGSSYSAWSNMSNFMSSYNTVLTTELKITISTPPVTGYITWSFTDA